MHVPGIVRSQNFDIGRQSRSATRVPAISNMKLMVNTVQSEPLIQILAGSSLINVEINETLMIANIRLLKTAFTKRHCA